MTGGDSRPQRRFYPPAAQSVAPNGQGAAGKVPVGVAGYRQWVRRDRGRNWKEADGGGGPDLPPGSEEEAKRRWEKSGLAWMKRARTYDGKSRDDVGDSKRRWEKSGMSWMKRRQGDGEKRRWEKSGMSWMKRRPAYNNDDPAVHGGPAETTNRRWEKSGTSWIRRRK